jgi:hypothetical protein
MLRRLLTIRVMRLKISTGREILVCALDFSRHVYQRFEGVAWDGFTG